MKTPMPPDENITDAAPLVPEFVAMHDDLCLQSLIDADPELRELSELTQFATYVRATLGPRPRASAERDRVRRIQDQVLRSIGALPIAAAMMSTAAQDRALSEKFSAFRRAASWPPIGKGGKEQ